jgi:hypothetical protein
MANATLSSALTGVVPPACDAEAGESERDDEWLDEVLSQTFPASDPVPAGHKDTGPTEKIMQASPGPFSQQPFDR